MTLLSPLNRYATARESMVVSQLQPSGVIDEDILNAYRIIPREIFVPEAQKSVCYLDDGLKLSHGRVLLEPLLHGVMVENLHVRKSDLVLDIGGLSGYSACILSQLGDRVFAIDEDANAISFAADIPASLSIHNVEFAVRRHAEGWAQARPYDIILINGAVAERPQALLDQLAAGGRLACIHRPDPRAVGKVVVFTKEVSGVVSELKLLDAVTDYVPGFAPLPVFTF